MITPNTTIITPTRAEYSFDETPFFSNNNEISLRNNENLTITKPKPINAILVRIQARNVLSLAMYSLDFPNVPFSKNFAIAFRLSMMNPYMRLMGTPSPDNKNSMDLI